jgi:5'-nucleotidase
VHGTPVDCVYLALYHLKLDIGCVISGINDGPNLGDDIWYSGTVAAAREATLNGLPGIAVSQVYKNPAQLSMIAQKIVDLYGENPPQKGRIYNYNFPKDAVAYVQQCFLGRRQRGDTTETVTDLRGKNWVWLGAPKDGIIEKGSDFDVISKNMISLTIL